MASRRDDKGLSAASSTSSTTTTTTSNTTTTTTTTTSSSSSTSCPSSASVSVPLAFTPGHCEASHVLRMAGSGQGYDTNNITTTTNNNNAPNTMGDDHDDDDDDGWLLLSATTYESDTRGGDISAEVVLSVDDDFIDVKDDAAAADDDDHDDDDNDDAAPLPCAEPKTFCPRPNNLPLPRYESLSPAELLEAALDLSSAAALPLISTIPALPCPTSPLCMAEALPAVTIPPAPGLDSNMTIPYVPLSFVAPTSCPAFPPAALADPGALSEPVRDGPRPLAAEESEAEEKAPSTATTAVININNHRKNDDDDDDDNDDDDDDDEYFYDDDGNIMSYLCDSMLFEVSSMYSVDMREDPDYDRYLLNDFTATGHRHLRRRESHGWPTMKAAAHVC